MVQNTSGGTTVAYGRRLMRGAITGVRSGHKNFDPKRASSLVSRSAGESLKLAAIGACIGFLPAWLVRRRARMSTAIALGALGSALGFCVGFSWKTRGLTSTLAHSALREVRRVNEERWLEKNPIDYA
jgi:hypothetical protein